MSMTKRYLESLSPAEQDAILGPVYGDDWAGQAENEPTAPEDAGVDPDYEAWWAEREALENKRERDRIIDGGYEIGDADPGL
jgi:hypothetical protein